MLIARCNYCGGRFDTSLSLRSCPSCGGREWTDLTPEPEPVPEPELKPEPPPKPPQPPEPRYPECRPPVLHVLTDAEDVPSFTRLCGAVSILLVAGFLAALVYASCDAEKEMQRQREQYEQHH